MVGVEGARHGRSHLRTDDEPERLQAQCTGDVRTSGDWVGLGKGEGRQVVVGICVARAGSVTTMVRSAGGTLAAGMQGRSSVS